MKDQYPDLKDSALSSVVSVLRRIVQLRRDDVSDFTALPKRFVKGRKVEKIPTSSTDILDAGSNPDSRPGDINYDTGHFYICVDNAGTPAWRRATLSSW